MEEIFDLKELTTKYSKMIFRIARGYLNTKEDAEDIVQEVFIKYMLSIKNGKIFTNDEYEKFWLIKVTINMCCNEIYSAKRRNKFQFKETLYCDLNISSENLLYEAIGKLENKYKEVFILFYIEDMKISKISKLLNISESNVKTRLKRARNKVKEHMKKGIESYEKI